MPAEHQVHAGLRGHGLGVVGVVGQDDPRHGGRDAGQRGRQVAGRGAEVVETGQAELLPAAVEKAGYQPGEDVAIARSLGNRVRVDTSALGHKAWIVHGEVQLRLLPDGDDDMIGFEYRLASRFWDRSAAPALVGFSATFISIWFFALMLFLFVGDGRIGDIFMGVMLTVLSITLVVTVIASLIAIGINKTVG